MGRKSKHGTLSKNSKIGMTVAAIQMASWSTGHLHAHISKFVLVESEESYSE